MHRVILPDAEEVDHINGNGLDNRRANLRPATGIENRRNRRRSRKNTSGYAGVSWDKVNRKWYAYITADGRMRALGRFDTAEEAALARDRAALELHGEFARLNFPAGVAQCPPKSNPTNLRPWKSPGA